MKNTSIAVVAALTALTLAPAAHAVSYSATQSQILTEPGQDLFFTFDGLPQLSGPGLVTVASGASGFIPGIDLTGSDAEAQEYFEATIDGTSLGLYSCGGSAGVGANVIPGTEGTSPIFDCVFSLPITLTPELSAEVLADGIAEIGILFSAGVEDFTEEDEVAVTVSYTVAPIPLPASLPLLAVGLAGLGVAARRRRS